MPSRPCPGRSRATRCSRSCGPSRPSTPGGFFGPIQLGKKLSNGCAIAHEGRLRQVAARHTGARVPLLTARLRAEPHAAPLALHEVGAAYGRIEVLHGVDIEVPRGDIATLLGPNGAGKTTTLGVMSGLLTPTRGCRHVQGRHLNHAGADSLARLGICHIREGRSVFPNLSVADNLIVAASCGASPDRLWRSPSRSSRA